VLDGENELLKRQVSGFYNGLLLSSTFTLGRPPILLTGDLKDGELNVLQQSLLGLSFSSLPRPFASVQVGEVEQAARFGSVHEHIIVSPPPGGAWRLIRALTAAYNTRGVVYAKLAASASPTRPNGRTLVASQRC
jgi:hypothetical protein